MLVDLNTIPPVTVPGMNGGTGEMTAKMFADKSLKVISCAIHKGGSIGLHKHTASDDINYVVSGTGKAYCGGAEEKLSAGTCHICPKGSQHCIVNTGDDDLVLITVVTER